MRIAMIGTRGVPARYGGFETCVEEVGARLAAAGNDVTVYCRASTAPGDRAPLVYRGMSLVHLSAVRERHLETLSHTALSIAHVVRRNTDAAIVFNAANAPLLPALRARGIPVAVHVDGLEWKRAKWGGAGRRYYRRAESLAVRWADALIADARGIADYYASEFGVETHLIRYGAPIVETACPEQLTPLGLERKRFHLVVARFEPENHVDVIVEGYTRSTAAHPLVVVGGAPYGDGYTGRVRRLGDERVRFLGPVWDQDLLDQLYVNCLTYQHGHSVGGTNPSLLRAIGAGAATNAFDVSFNREVLGDSGAYWTTPDEVAALIGEAESELDALDERAALGRQRASTYRWDDVADDYEKLCRQLAAGEVVRPRSAGRYKTSCARTDAG